MIRASRIVLLVLLLAALPLRGYAGALMSPCETQHGGVPVSNEHMHEHGDSHHDDSGDGGGPAHTASVCSVCASCCAGASIAPDVLPTVLPQIQGPDRISFPDRSPSGFVPEHLDRPPLAS